MGAEKETYVMWEHHTNHLAEETEMTKNALDYKAEMVAMLTGVADETAAKLQKEQARFAELVTAGSIVTGLEFERLMEAQFSARLGRELQGWIKRSEGDAIAALRVVLADKTEDLLYGRLDPRSTSSVANAESDIELKMVRRFVRGWAPRLAVLDEKLAKESADA